MVVQHKLGARNAGTFDLGCACASFTPLIAIGSGLIATNLALKTVLLVAVDMIYRLCDPNDVGCFLWSDGAGAIVLEGGTEAGFIGAAFQADGRYASGWGILAGGTFEPASIEAVKAGRTQVRREGGNYPKTNLPDLAVLVELMLIVRRVLREQIVILHRRLLAIVRDDEVCRRLMTTPGIGPVVSLTYRATVDIPARFRKSKSVGAVFGLTCAKYQSGGGGLGRQNIALWR